MRHPGRPHRWDADSILSALRTWVAETGRPPRRQDWSGERPDAAAPAQRKWMLEHPRWPSSSCVSAHFGSWSQALQDAGLPARSLTFDAAVADRVEAAWRLAVAGCTIRMIADELGVSVSTVHNYLKARTCPDCGGPVPSPRALRCIACTAHLPTVQSPWTRAAVCEAIQAWADEHGGPPSYRDWTPSRSTVAQWELENPRWPSAAVVCDVYGGGPSSWNAALIDAGVGIRFRRWNDAAIRAALAAFWTRTGRRLTAADLSAPEWRGPGLGTLRRRYGGVEHAWEALGPVPAPVRSA
jgi:hypothetical protein